MRVSADDRKAISRTGYLTGRISIAEFAWIRPHDHRQSRPRFISGRQIKCRGQLHAILTLISDELMSHTTKLRLRIFEFGCGAPRITAEIANIIVRWIGLSLVASKNSLCFVIKRRDYCLISL